MASTKRKLVQQLLENENAKVAKTNPCLTSFCGVTRDLWLEENDCKELGGVNNQPYSTSFEVKDEEVMVKQERTVHEDTDVSEEGKENHHVLDIDGSETVKVKQEELEQKKKEGLHLLEQLIENSATAQSKTGYDVQEEHAANEQRDGEWKKVEKKIRRGSLLCLKGLNTEVTCKADIRKLLESYRRCYGKHAWISYSRGDTECIIKFCQKKRAKEVYKLMMEAIENEIVLCGKKLEARVLEGDEVVAARRKLHEDFLKRKKPECTKKSKAVKKAEAKAKAKEAKAKAEVKAKAVKKAEARAKAKEAKAKAEVKAKAVKKAEAKANAKEAKAKAEVKAKTEEEAKAEGKAKAEVKPKAEAKVMAEAKAGEELEEKEIAASEQNTQTTATNSEEEVHIICQPCGRDGLRFPAYGYCSNCKEHLCESCFNHHKRHTMSRNHTLLNQDNMPQTVDSLTTLCQKHDEEVIKYFCNDHKKLLCSLCVSTNHPVRYCQVDYIPYVSKKVLYNTEYSDILKSMDNLSLHYLTELGKVKNISEESFKHVLADILDVKEQIITRTEELMTQAVRDLDAVHQESKEQMKTMESAFNEVVESLKSSSSSLKHLKESKQSDTLFIELKLTEQKINDCERKIKDLKENNNVKTYNFQPNPAITALLETEESLGIVESLGNDDLTARKAEYQGQI